MNKIIVIGLRHYDSFSEGIDFSRKILTSMDIRRWRVKSFLSLKGLICVTHTILVDSSFANNNIMVGPYHEEDLHDISSNELALFKKETHSLCAKNTCDRNQVGYRTEETS